MTSRKHLATSTLGLTLAAMLYLGVAANAGAAEATPPAAAAKQPIGEVLELDEIVVRGTSLRDAIADAEDNFFVLFNKVNKDDDFDTNCVYVTLDSLSSIRSRMCVPGFYADALADQVYFQQSCLSDTMTDDEGNETVFDAVGCYTPPSPQAVLGERAREYANHMLRVIRTDPKLQSLAGNLDDLYYELLDVQKQYLKVKSASQTEKAPAAPAEGPRIQ
jgi:hypothetical protein